MKLHFDIAKKEKILRELLLSLIFFYRMTTYWRFFLHLPTFLNWQANSRPYQITFWQRLTRTDIKGLFNDCIVVSFVQRMCCNEKSSHLPKRSPHVKSLFSQTLTIRLEWKMFYLPMRSCWSNTIDHSTKASSERLGQESIQNGVDAGVTIGE